MTVTLNITSASVVWPMVILGILGTVAAWRRSTLDERAKRINRKARFANSGAPNRNTYHFHGEVELCRR